MSMISGRYLLRSILGSKAEFKHPDLAIQMQVNSQYGKFAAASVDQRASRATQQIYRGICTTLRQAQIGGFVAESALYTAVGHFAKVTGIPLARMFLGITEAYNRSGECNNEDDESSEVSE